MPARCVPAVTRSRRPPHSAAEPTAGGGAGHRTSQRKSLLGSDMLGCSLTACGLEGTDKGSHVSPHQGGSGQGGDDVTCGRQRTAGGSGKRRVPPTLWSVPVRRGP